VTSYHEYLCIDRLLSAQRPYTDVADERIFITVHQLFELTFKQMLADFTIIDNACREMGEQIQQNGLGVLLEGGKSGFWKQPLHASNRLVRAVKKLLPEVFHFLAYNPGKETFDSAELARFRLSLIGASGFQSAQFRAIQKALGKASLFKIRPIILWNGSQRSWRLLEIDHPDSLCDWIPPAPTLDDTVHSLLKEIFARTGEVDHPAGLALVTSDFEPAESAFPKHIETVASKEPRLIAQKKLRTQAPQLTKEFGASLRRATRLENHRRRDFSMALAGANWFKRNLSDHALVRIFDSITLIDRSLFGDASAGEPGFLGWHKITVENRINEAIELSPSGVTQPAGTGGQGISYLELNRRHLTSRFPALAAWREQRVVEVK
jgi:hypothetical protein